MKKQIFILVMAFFAIGLSNAYAQLAPRAIVCLPSDALHPIAGTKYTYKVDVPTPSGDKKYQWLVTQDQNFITNKVLTTTFETPATSKFLAAAGSTYNIVQDKTGATASSDTISLIWKSFTYDTSKPVFVVVNVINNDGTCTPNNLKVYKIQPIFAFTLDIANIDKTGTTMGYDTPDTKCISPIISAVYNVAKDAIDYDFGADTLMYEVTAANWSSAWRLSVKLSGVGTKETVSVQYATTKAFTTPVTMTGSLVGTGAAEDYVTATADSIVPTYAANTTTKTVGVAGESIFIRVILDHSDAALNYQGLADEVVVLAIDGKTMLSATTPLGDVHYDNGPAGATPCAALVVDDYTNDKTTQTILPRPDVTAAASASTITLVPVVNP